MARFTNFLNATLLAGSLAAIAVPAAAQSNTITLSGTVQRVGTHTIAVWENGRNTTGEWIVTNAPRYRVGETITGWGTEDRFGHFYPQRVVVGAVPNTVTLRGTVQRVGTHTIAVWEPARHTTGQWVVADAGQFRVGQRVAANGTINRYGDFFPTSIWTP